MMLNGTVDAAVNGGISLYIEAFFSEDYLKSNKLHVPSLLRLQAAIRNLVNILEQALKTIRQFSSAKLLPLYAHLENTLQAAKKAKLNEIMKTDYVKLSESLRVEDDKEKLKNEQKKVQETTTTNPSS